MIDLRPLTLKEGVDRSASLWRTHWKSLFKLYLGFQLGQFVLLKSWELLTMRFFPLVRNGPQLTEALKVEPFEAFRQVGEAWAS